MNDPRHGLVPITLADWQMYRNDGPLSQFMQVALIADEATKQAIEQQCIEHGYAAGIDYMPNPGVNCYVWQMLSQPSSKSQWVFPLERRLQGRRPLMLSTEQQLFIKICKILETNQISFETEVTCAAGRADIVTHQRDIIYELKGHLWRQPLLLAVAQVLLYRVSINPQARVAIIGYETSETAALLPIIESLGIRVILWKD